MQKIIEIPKKKTKFYSIEKSNVILMKSLNLFFHCDRFIHACVCACACVRSSDCTIDHRMNHDSVIDEKIIRWHKQCYLPWFKRQSSSDKQVNTDSLHYLFYDWNRSGSCADIKKQEYIHMLYCVPLFVTNSELLFVFMGS